MIKYYLKNKDEKIFTEIGKPQKSCWIHSPNATNDSLLEISGLLEIDTDEITDALDLMEIPRVEKIESNTFVIFTRFPSVEETGIYTSPLTVIISPAYFVTITPTNCGLIEKIAGGISKHGPSDKTEFLVHILLGIIQSYTRVIKKIRADVILHERDLTKVGEKDITDLTHMEENLNQCLNAILPLKGVIKDLLSGKFVQVTEDDQDNLEDLLLASEQADALCDLSLRIITSLRNSVQVVISNEFNKTIKLLTALTIVLNFPTTIASLFGMNVHLPFQNSEWGFSIVMTFIIISLIGSIWFFQRKRWL
jgi:magnesium transporter